VISSLKSKKTPVRKKAVSWLGVGAQRWRCREEALDIPFDSLPMYPVLPLVLAPVSVFVVGDGVKCVAGEFAQESRCLVLRALLAQEWQESRGLAGGSCPRIVSLPRRQPTQAQVASCEEVAPSLGTYPRDALAIHLRHEGS
jgi:hypothetical protein